MSNRKPHNHLAGYVCELRAGETLAGQKGHVVIYKALPAGMGESGYMTVCESHNEMVSSSNLPLARACMKMPRQFCEECQRIWEKKQAGHDVPAPNAIVEKARSLGWLPPLVTVLPDEVEAANWLNERAK